MSDAILVDHPLIAHKLTIMRKKETPPPLFRALLKEISFLMGYEVTRTLPTENIDIETPVGATSQPQLSGRKMCIHTILRAGNGFLEGLLDLMPTAKVGTVGLYRDPNDLHAVEYYFKVPPHLGERFNLVVDPMLATGNTAVAAITRLKEAGAKDITFMCLLCAPEGIRALKAAHPDVPIYTAAIDERLNDHSYIVPGLGDAGDRIYGTL